MPTLIMGEAGDADLDREAAALYLDAMLDGSVPFGGDPNASLGPVQPPHFAPQRLGGLVSGRDFELPGDFGMFPGGNGLPNVN